MPENSVYHLKDGDIVMTFVRDGITETRLYRGACGKNIRTLDPVLNRGEVIPKDKIDAMHLLDYSI